MIRLKRLSDKNWMKLLNRFGDDPGGNLILLLTHVYQDRGGVGYDVYDGEVLVGMAMRYDWEIHAAYGLSQVYIDKQYRDRHYEVHVIRLLLEELRQEGKYKKALSIRHKEAGLDVTPYLEAGFVQVEAEIDEEVALEAVL